MTRQNTGQRVFSGANKLPGAPSSFKTPPKIVEKQGFYGGVTSLGSSSGSGSPVNDSNPIIPILIQNRQINAKTEKSLII